MYHIFTIYLLLKEPKISCAHVFVSLCFINSPRVFVYNSMLYLAFVYIYIHPTTYIYIKHCRPSRLIKNRFKTCANMFSTSLCKFLLNGYTPESGECWIYSYIQHNSDNRREEKINKKNSPFLSLCCWVVSFSI